MAVRCAFITHASRGARDLCPQTTDLVNSNQKRLDFRIFHHARVARHARPLPPRPCTDHRVAATQQRAARAPMRAGPCARAQMSFWLETDPCALTVTERFDVFVDSFFLVDTRRGSPRLSLPLSLSLYIYI